MKAILVASAPVSTQWLKSELTAKMRAPGGRTILIGIDGGVGKLRQAGFSPDLAVGDWDSFPERRLGSIPHLSLPQKKDRSDLFYGLATARSLDVSEIACFGVTGGRPDHHLASLFEMSEASRRMQVTAFSEEGDYHFLSKKFPRVAGGSRKSKLVSLFALTTTRVEKMSGLEYLLQSGSQILSSSLGLSNVVTGRQWSIRIRSGTALVFLPVICNHR